MAGFVRTKRVTDPLDARVRDRLVGRDQASELRYASSGSEHSAAAENDDSPCLSELVHGFLEEAESEDRHDSDSERVESSASESRSDAAESVFRWSDSGNADTYRKLLFAHAAEAAEAFARLRSNRAVFRRSVMSRLRERGHNAAICKTRWDSSGGLTAGSYEFIDAVLADTGKRYFIDLDFAAEFQIARPSPHYSRLAQTLPRLFVGDSDDLRRIVRAMCDAAKRSMRTTELSLPPWRKNRYMQNKWFGPYRRSVNPVPENSFSSATATKTAVKCCCVGFDNAVVSDVNVNGRAFVRTR